MLRTRSAADILRRTGLGAATFVVAAVVLAGPAGAEECTQPAPGVRMGDCEPAAASSSEQSTEAKPAPGVDESAASRMLSLINRDRATHGLGPMSARGDVTGQAVEWSKHMASTGTLAHNDAYFAPSNRQRLNASAMGENVAYNHDVDDAHRRLMDSPGHRANILDARFSVVGIGVVRDANGRHWITQDFIQPAGGSAPAPAPAAAPAPAPAPPPAAPAPSASAAPAPAPAAATPPPATTTESPAGAPTAPAAGAPAAPDAPPAPPAGADGDETTDEDDRTVELALGPAGTGGGVAVPANGDAGSAVRLVAIASAGVAAAALLRLRRRLATLA